MKLRFICFSAVFLILSTSVIALADETFLLPLKKGNLSAKISSPSECTWGEMNAIFLDLNEHRSKSVPADILLSIEALDASFEKSIPTDIPRLHREEIKDLQTLRLPLPASTEEKVVAIVVCKDSRKRASCQDLAAQSLQDTLRRHQVQFDKNGKLLHLPSSQTDVHVAPDGVYFYQLAVYGPQGLRIQTDSFNKNSLSEFLNDKQFTKDLSEKQKKRASEALRITRSANLHIDHDQLVIDLPSVDQGKCEQFDQDK